MWKAVTCCIGCIVSIIGSFPVIAEEVLTPSQIKQRMIQELILASEWMNASTPIMVDPDIRLDKTSVGPGAKLSYFYTLVNHKAFEIDKSSFLIDVKGSIVQQACSHPDMAMTLFYGGAYRYVYHSSDLQTLASFDVVKNDCYTSSTSNMIN